MRKVIAVLILIGLGALLIINPSIYNKKDDDKTSKLYDTNITEEEILELAKADQGVLDFSVESLQGAPDQIVAFNAMVMKVMYGYEDFRLEDEEIELLAKIQRKYYHDDLLEINPEALHLLGIVKEAEKAHEETSWIIDYNVFPPEYSNSDPNNVATVKVAFVPNSFDSSDDIYMRYLVEREEDGLWYIKGWVGMDESEIKVIE